MTGFSAEFLKGIYQAINPLYPYIFQTPVLPLAADDAETLLDLFDLLYEKALRKEHCYCRLSCIIRRSGRWLFMRGSCV